MALVPFNQKKKKKEKDSNRHYGWDREVVYASEWFFLFKAMVDDNKRLNLVALSEMEHSSKNADTDTPLRCAKTRERRRERKGTVVYCASRERKGTVVYSAERERKGTVVYCCIV